jgi:phosphate transport system substrate-binding protein
MSGRRTFAVVVLLVVLAIFGGGCGENSASSVTLDAGGATFVQPIMKFWTDAFRDLTDNQVRINYQGTGSSDGIKRMISKEFAFGCSDAPMTQAEVDAAKQNGGEVVHIPLVVGAVVVTYNLPIEQSLTLTGPLVADIFLGKVKKWNDPAITGLNPGLALPNWDIQPVFRSEGSGTSYIFSEYLSKVSPEFKNQVGATKSFPDKVGVGKKGSDGVAGHITATNGAVGYVELTYALDTKAKFAKLVNKAGKPVEATLKSITAAAAVGMNEKQTIAPYNLHDLTYNLTDMAGDDSYPIAATSFCILYQKQLSARGQSIVEFLKWVTSAHGQKLAEKRKFAALPTELQKKIAEKLTTIEFAR